MLILEKLKHIPVILGSQSPRRQELLRQLDIDFTVEIRETDEYIDRALSPPDIVKAISSTKLSPFEHGMYWDKLVIVSDTLVVDKDGNILGKPKDAEEAKEVLGKLSGEKHVVYTAVALAYQGQIRQFVESTDVWFDDISDEEIAYYIRQYNPYDKAGSYGIQEWIGRVAVREIKGSYENVMGLPTARLYQELKNFI